MWIDNEYHIQTYEELLQCSMQKLDVPDGTVVVLDEDLLFQVRKDIMQNQCSDADILAPYLNQFFVDDKDKLVKDLLRYNIPELGVVSDKYDPQDELDEEDYIEVWLPQGLWDQWNQQVRVNKWLLQTPRIVHRG